MEVKNLFNEMISMVMSPSLKKWGYTKVRNSFYLPSEGNWGIIDFQKSQKSDSSQIKFTVNIGIASRRILNFLGFEEKNKKPNIWDSQFMVRLGHLLPENSDIWWTIDQETTIEELGLFTVDLVIKYALPAIQEHLSDESLRDLWRSGKSPSLTEFQRLLYLSVLVKQIVPVEILEPTINELQRLSLNKPTAVAAEVFITKLKSLQ